MRYCQIQCNFRDSEYLCKLGKQYLNTLLCNFYTFFWTKFANFWHITRLSITNHRKVINIQKWSDFFGPPCSNTFQNFNFQLPTLHISINNKHPTENNITLKNDMTYFINITQQIQSFSEIILRWASVIVTDVHLTKTAECYISEISNTTENEWMPMPVILALACCYVNTAEG